MNDKFERSLNSITERLRILKHLKNTTKNEKFFQSNKSKGEQLHSLDEIGSPIESHQKLCTTVKLLSDALEEQSQLRALLEYSIEKPKPSLSPKVDGQKVIEKISYRGLQIEKERLLAQVIDLKTKLEAEKKLANQKDTELKVANDMLQTQDTSIAIRHQINERNFVDDNNDDDIYDFQPLSRSNFQLKNDKVLKPPLLSNNNDDFMMLEYQCQQQEEFEKEKSPSPLKPKEIHSISRIGDDDDSKYLTKESEVSASTPSNTLILDVELGDGKGSGEMIITVDSNPTLLVSDFLESNSLTTDYFEPLLEYVISNQIILRKGMSVHDKSSNKPQTKPVHQDIMNSQPKPDHNENGLTSNQQTTILDNTIMKSSSSKPPKPPPPPPPPPNRTVDEPIVTTTRAESESPNSFDFALSSTASSIASQPSRSTTPITADMKDLDSFIPPLPLSPPPTYNSISPLLSPSNRFPINTNSIQPVPTKPKHSSTSLIFGNFDAVDPTLTQPTQFELAKKMIEGTFFRPNSTEMKPSASNHAAKPPPPAVNFNTARSSAKDADVEPHVKLTGSVNKEKTKEAMRRISISHDRNVIEAIAQFHQLKHSKDTTHIPIESEDQSVQATHLPVDSSLVMTESSRNGTVVKTPYPQETCDPPVNGMVDLNPTSSGSDSSVGKMQLSNRSVHKWDDITINQDRRRNAHLVDNEEYPSPIRTTSSSTDRSYHRIHDTDEPTDMMNDFLVKQQIARNKALGSHRHVSIHHFDSHTRRKIADQVLSMTSPKRDSKIFDIQRKDPHHILGDATETDWNETVKYSGIDTDVANSRDIVKKLSPHSHDILGSADPNETLSDEEEDEVERMKQMSAIGLVHGSDRSMDAEEDDYRVWNERASSKVPKTFQGTTRDIMTNRRSLDRQDRYVDSLQNPYLPYNSNPSSAREVEEDDDSIVEEEGVKPLFEETMDSHDSLSPRRKGSSVWIPTKVTEWNRSLEPIHKDISRITSIPTSTSSHNPPTKQFPSPVSRSSHNRKVSPPMRSRMAATSPSTVSSTPKISRWPSLASILSSNNSTSSPSRPISPTIRSTTPNRYHTLKVKQNNVKNTKEVEEEDEPAKNEVIRISLGKFKSPSRIFSKAFQMSTSSFLSSTKKIPSDKNNDLDMDSIGKDSISDEKTDNIKSRRTMMMNKLKMEEERKKYLDYQRNEMNPKLHRTSSPKQLQENLKKWDSHHGDVQYISLPGYTLLTPVTGRLRKDTEVLRSDSPNRKDFSKSNASNTSNQRSQSSIGYSEQQQKRENKIRSQLEGYKYL